MATPRHNCRHTYDPAKGDKWGKFPPGVAFEALPKDWKCPCCGASKKMFKKLDGRLLPVPVLCYVCRIS